jgi:hypothetical protein
MYFPSSHIAHATLGYMCLNVKKDSGATFEKREEKVRRERDRKGKVSYLARRAYLPKRNKFRDE